MTAASVKTIAIGPPDAGELALVVFGAPATGDRAEPFWLLRRHAEASIYLGALLDASGAVHELLEIWVQRIEGFMASQPVLAKTWTKADLDKRWQELREEIARADGMATLRLAVEQQPTAPVDLSFNPEGGKIFCRPAGIIGWRDFAAILRGGVWNPGVPEEWLALLPPVHAELARERDSVLTFRHFLLPAMGEEAGPAEATYLRLALLHGAVEAVAKATARRGSPYLNLSDEHFGIRLGDSGLGLPALWSAKVVLNRGGGAVAVSDPKGNKHFLPDVTATPGPFRIAGPIDSQRAIGSLRIRKLGAVVGGRASVEATLQTEDFLEGQAGYRLEILVETPGWTRVIPGEIGPGAGPREWLFAGSISPEGHAELVEGASYTKVEVLLHPKLGSACDLYSLGVLGLQLFLATEERSLAVVADEMLMLRDRGVPLQSAAPEWLQRENPGALQWEVLELLLGMLRGKPSDGLDEAPEAIYREPLRRLEDLLRRARAAVFGEGGRNQEIRDEIRILLDELRQSV